MNCISLIGCLAAAPTYFCTQEGRDLTRFVLDDTADTSRSHHCQAWGPAALDLHTHLRTGNRLLVRGELRYRSRLLPDGTSYNVPVIHVLGYSYLG